MAYRWKPNATQRREFSEKMKDEKERKAYEDRKRYKNSYAGFNDKKFIPTKMQYDYTMHLIGLNYESMSNKVKIAANIVSSAFVCQDKIHHDYIHIINSIHRGDNTPLSTEF